MCEECEKNYDEEQKRQMCIIESIEFSWITYFTIEFSHYIALKMGNEYEGLCVNVGFKDKQMIERLIKVVERYNEYLTKKIQENNENIKIAKNKLSD